MKRKGVTAAVIAIAVVAVLVAGTAAAGLYVNKLETIYPNVSMGGVDLSGMTAGEAAAALRDAGYEDNAQNIAATVVFPDGESMTVTGSQAGLGLVADSAAVIAHSHGRDGGFFARLFGYINSLFKPADLDKSGAAPIDEAVVRGVIEKQTARFNAYVMEEACTVTDGIITLTKGNGTTLADDDAVYALVEEALRQSVLQDAPVTVDYVLAANGEISVDFESMYDSVYVEPVSAIYDTGEKAITDSVTGVSFDIGAARAAFDAAPVGGIVTIPLIYTEPEVTRQALEALIFRDILSEKRTYVSGTSNRVHNVRKSAEAINGTILNPGETFSFNKIVGERTAARGYKEAGAYAGGRVVQEVGGGICQGSSTLYHCVLYADLEVVERRNHMFIVTYLPLGNDATINWGTIDFKFKNNTEYPIKIDIYMDGGYLQVKLHGTKTNDTRVHIEPVTISTTPFKTIQREDPSIAPGTTKEDTSGYTGYVIDTYKYIYDANDKLLSKTFIERNTYRTQDKVILVPVGTLTPVEEPSPEPSPSPSAEPSPSPSPEPSPEPSPSPQQPDGQPPSDSQQGE